MNKKIMIMAELSGNQINPSFYELLSKGKEVFEKEGAQYVALVLGQDIQSHLEEVRKSGVDGIYYLDDERLAVFHPEYYRDAATAAVHLYDPDVLLIGATAIGEELAPSLGITLNTGVAAHCTDLVLTDEGCLAQMVPAFGGKVIGEIFTPNTKPQIASVKPGMFQINEQEQQMGCEMIPISSRILDDRPTNIEVVKVTKDQQHGVPLEKAEVVICGGLGVGGNDNWNSLDRLAGVLGGAVGCTRPVVDAGWVEDESTMIGTSGKSISPKLYLGAAIGGATHHVCGIKGAGTIININTDPNAESFQVSDYKVVGDSNEIINALLERLA